MNRPLVRPHAARPSIPSLAAYFLREAFRRIWISRRTSFAAILMIALALSIVGVFLIVSDNLNRALERWQAGSKLVIFFDPEAGGAAVAEVERFLAAQKDFGARRFISRAEALKRFRETFSNLATVVDELDTNPFPASFEVEVSRGTVDSPTFDDRVSLLRRMPGVQEVQFDWEWLARLRTLLRAVNGGGLIVGGVLALAAAFMIANVIRLTMFLYRDEIEIMRLVGATEGIVRGPFFLEGLLQGALGSLLAIAALYGLFEWGQYAAAQAGSAFFNILFVSFLSWEKTALLVAGGTIAGLFGSWLSLREAGPEPFA
jgi:cell division transport system permease protein